MATFGAMGDGSGAGGRGRDGTPFAGGLLALAVVGSLGLVSALGLLVLGSGPEGLRWILRVTGRTSTLLFASAFAASGAYLLRPAAGTRWLRRNRRYLGLSFAGSQGIHLMALVELTAAAEVRPDAATLVVGGIGYLFTLAMAATSFDGAVRWLGRRWRTLHLVGGWWIFAVLVATIVPAAGNGILEMGLAGVLVATLAIRVAAARRRRAR